MRLAQFEVMGEILKANESGCGFHNSPRVLVSVKKNKKGLYLDTLSLVIAMDYLDPAPLSSDTSCSWSFLPDSKLSALVRSSI
ncbi:hypothetical protein TNCT_26051 [Trichonephila clavata]|uniref:Uncharacterized protein n=1 Tax=Trichonephila clavata TaxID=2740835 RepID=A0A8X6KCA3_TRICU|nr:hypothetical protein TNCT_26051 [Trichonephila clavata]